MHEETYDVIVVGAGHAGCEAALACARLGFETIIFTVSIDAVGFMPCNPHIGGTSKGHLVREVDALGGEMGKNIDKTYLQSKMLNKSKGPAVHSLRAQADKAEYSKHIRMTLQSTDHLTLRQAEVTRLLYKEIDVENTYSDACRGGVCPARVGSAIESNYIMTGVETNSGAIYHAKAVILCTGTYLKARCLYGEVVENTGPSGMKAANHLSDSLAELGIELVRFKTGTPARIDRRSIDFSKMEIQLGDEPVIPFSFENRSEDIAREQLPCYLTYTNEETHKIIRANLDRSPLFGGVIEGTGPRYCPSIEDKVVKFPDKDRHQLFVEPEGEFTNEMYIAGMSSSLPDDVQQKMYRTVPGLENAKIVRNAYAIEYDCINPNQLKPSLEFKDVTGLFAGGQFNGSSGYEEAAAQGIIAGINACRFLQGKEPIILDRSSSYIGVLIDDLVTKENHEPYRMMTSRAEYRLILRQDNADLRLSHIGYEVGLLSKERYDYVEEKRQLIQDEIRRVSEIIVPPSENVQKLLSEHGSSPLASGISFVELIRRPELSYDILKPIDPDRPELSDEVCEQVNIEIKYEGYISRQRKQIEEFRKLESKTIPEGIDYLSIDGIRKEAREKLNRLRPVNIGQAGRISGVSPADISVLLVFLEQSKN